MSQFNDYLRKLLRLSKEKREQVEARLRAENPEGYKHLVDYLKAHPGAVHEAQGYEHLLRRIGQKTFTRPFAPIQHRFWEWNWNALQKLQDKEPLEPREKVGFLPWPRETGKSSTVEWACILEGALLKSGYVIYLCAKLSQAIDHVVAIRDRIESEHVAELYPWLGKPKLGTHGNKFGWGQEFLMTGGGWAIRPVGADVAMRGGKAINIRPSLIVPDDYDELDDSPHVVEHKEHMLTRAILPMGDANTRVLVPQNPIHANSVVNRMLTGASLALAIRTVFGELNEDGTLSSRPIPAVKGLVYEVRQSDEGPYCEITQGESNWDGITVDDWAATLNRVGPEAFKAEYQHDMTVAQEERVLPEYDDRNLRLHVITWSQFEQKYQQRRIPSDWPCDVGLDIGYSGSHKSAWTFLTKVPAAYELAGSVFRYRGRTFTGTSIDEQAVTIAGELWPNEQLQREFMSHEKLGERLVLAQKHGWHFIPCDSAKIAGIAQWRHFLKPDRSQPHPFHRDEKDVNGRWRLGRPAWFDIVDDKQFFSPVDDLGLKRHRDGAFNWRQVPVKLTDKGLTVEQPAKMDDDECLVAGTMITTRRGEIAIEYIQPNDVVLTRQGWRNVIACGQTKSKAEIWTIILSNGYQLSGTKRHPIWVAGYGWKPLSELRAGERLLSLTECGSIATLTRSTGHIGRTLSHTFMRFVTVLGLYTLNYGNRFMEQYRKDIRFITEIIIRLITPTPTLSYSPAPNIAAITDEIARPNILRGSERIWRTCRNWLKSGTEAKRVESGIANTLRNPFASFLKLRSSVNTVEVSTALGGGLDAFARRDVSRLSALDGRNWQHRNEHVRTAGQRSTRWRTPDESNALTVVRSEPQNVRQPVYNLSVENVPEYFANGVLVHNCDSTRMLTVGFGPITVPLTQAQKVQAVIPAGYHKAELAATRHPNDAQMTSELAEWLAKRALKSTKPLLVDSFGQPLR